jgi:hypothetical protein
MNNLEMHYSPAGILGAKIVCAYITRGGGSNEEQKFMWEPSGVADVSRFVVFNASNNPYDRVKKMKEKLVKT